MKEKEKLEAFLRAYEKAKSEIPDCPPDCPDIYKCLDNPDSRCPDLRKPGIGKEERE